MRGLVADGSVRLAELAAGAEEFWLTSALVRVRGLDGMLVAAAGGLSAWSRTLISSALAFPLLWAAAWAAGAIGLGPAWVVAATVLVLGVAMPVLLGVTGRISRVADRRRMAAAAEGGKAEGGKAGSSKAGGSAGAPGGTVLKGDVDEVAEVLVRARVRLVSAALRQVDSRRWDAGSLTRLARRDRVIGRIADADLLLCQAIDFLEIHLAEQRPGRAA